MVLIPRNEILQRYREVMDLEPRSGTLDEKFSLNKLGCASGDPVDEVLALRLSRVNHACSPKAQHYYEENSKTKVLVANKLIKGNPLNRNKCTFYRLSTYTARFIELAC